MSLRVAIHDADRTRHRNVALGKIAAWHRLRGDAVEWFIPLMPYDLTYSGCVFSHSQRDPYLPENVIQGGTGYGLFTSLPDEIEHSCPDYGFLGVDHSMGFLTRGCPNRCPWCIVPQKEGDIRPHADILEFTRHRNVKLMDNNFLALPEYAVEQLAKIRANDLRVDFNQGLDARLIDATMARHLAKIRWWKPLRLACDRDEQMPEVERAVRVLRAAGVRPKQYSCYVLAKDVNSAHRRVVFLAGLGLDPFVQPYRPLDGGEPDGELRHLARWARPAIRRVTPWENYRYNMSGCPEREGVRI